MSLVIDFTVEDANSQMIICLVYQQYIWQSCLNEKEHSTLFSFISLQLLDLPSY